MTLSQEDIAPSDVRLLLEQAQSHHAIEYDVALLTGSATIFPKHLTNDVDLVLLTARSNGAAKKIHIGQIHGYDVEAMCYDAKFASTLAASPQLMFLLFREAAKIINGECISGLPQAHQHLKNTLISAQFPIKPVEDLLLAAARDISDSKLTLQQFLRAFQHVYLALGYIYSPIGPIKAKWILLSQYCDYPTSFQAVTDQLSFALSGTDLHSHLTWLRQSESAKTLRHGIRQNINDAYKLAKVSPQAAQFPLIIALFQIYTSQGRTAESYRRAAKAFQAISRSIHPELPPLAAQLRETIDQALLRLEQVRTNADVGMGSK